MQSFRYSPQRALKLDAFDMLNFWDVFSRGRVHAGARTKERWSRRYPCGASRAGEAALGE